MRDEGKREERKRRKTLTEKRDGKITLETKKRKKGHKIREYEKIRKFGNIVHRKNIKHRPKPPTFTPTTCIINNPPPPSLTTRP